MIDTDKYERILKDDDGRNNVFALDLLAEVKRLREELDGREAYIKRLSEQLSRATKWAYKQVLHNDSAMMDFEDYVWGEEE
jgi:hypothetical protein